jgi:hypothetical protein
MPLKQSQQWHVANSLCNNYKCVQQHCTGRLSQQISHNINAQSWDFGFLKTQPRGDKSVPRANDTYPKVKTTKVMIYRKLITGDTLLQR